VGQQQLTGAYARVVAMAAIAHQAEAEEASRLLAQVVQGEEKLARAYAQVVQVLQLLT